MRTPRMPGLPLSMKTFLQSLLCGFVICGGGGVSNMSHAATFGWSGGAGAGNAWLTAANWTNNSATPTNGDIALFALGGSATAIGFNLNGAPVTTTNMGAIVLGVGSTLDRTIGNSSTSAGALSNLFLYGTGGGLLSNLVAARTLTIAPFAQGGTTVPLSLRLMSGGIIHADGAINIVSLITEDVSRGITKTGAGVLTLSTNNLFSGGMLISAGTLQVGGGQGAGSFGTGAITNNAIINFNRSDSPTFNNVISGTGAINQMGSGTTILGGNNSFAGVMNISNGVLRIANANALGTTAGNTLIRGNTLSPRLELSGNISVAEPITLEARQAGALNAATILNQSGNNTLTGVITLTTGGSRYNFQTDSGSLAINGNLNPSGLTGTRELRFAGGANATLNGQVLAGGSPLDFIIIKESGASTVTIANFVVPPTRLFVNHGTLVFNSASSISNCTGVSLASNAVLNVAALANGLIVNSNSFVGGSGTVTGNVSTVNGILLAPGGLFTAGTLSFSNHFTLGGASNALHIDFNTSTTVDGGLNDLLVVHSNLTLNGTVYVTVNPLAGPPAPGAYTIIRYGTLTGSAANLVAAPGPYSVTFDDTTPGEIRMVVSGTSPTATWIGNGTNTNWDVLTTTNWFKALALSTFAQGDNVLFDDTSVNKTVNVVTNVAPTSVTVDTATNYIFQSSGAISGGGLIKQGPGTLTMNTPNLYAGPTIVSNGVLKLGHVQALGATNSGTVVADGATLDLNAIAPTIGASGYETFIVSGSGVNSTGAVINSGASIVNSGLRASVTLAGDTTFGGINRWDLFNGKLFGNGYKLTKTGPPEIALSGLGDTGLGDIDIRQGQLTILGTTTAGDPTKTLTVYSNATLAFWATGPNVINKNIILSNGIVVNSSGTVTTNAGAVTLLLSNTFNNSSDIYLNGPLDGSGSLTKNSGGQTVLRGTNTYNGNTIVLSSRLALAGNGSISNSPLIDVRSGGVFDVSQVNGGWNLASGQTLQGVGTVLGPVIAEAGTINPGLSPGTLSFSSNLTLNGSTVLFELGANIAEGGGVNDAIYSRDLTLLGASTIRILPLGPLDVGASAYKLFRYTNALTGGAANLNVVSDSRYSFAIDTGVANLVRLTASGAAGNLIWAGGYPGSETLWDTATTTNWLIGGLPDVFRAGDQVTFDDSSAYTNVSLVGSLALSAITMNGTQAYTLSGGSLLSSGSLTKNGTGRLILASDNPQFNVTNVFIADGALEIGNGGASGFIPAGVPITNNATLVLNRSDATTFPNVIRGLNGGLRKEGAGTATLSGANQFRGPVVVNNGILRFGNTNALGTNSSVTVNSGGQVDFAGIAPVGKIFNYTIAGNGPDGRGAVNNTGAGVFGNSSISNVTLSADASVGTFGTGGDGGRYDFGTGNTTAGQYGLFNANNFTLTKLGPGNISHRIPSTNFPLLVVSNGLYYGENFDFTLATNVIVYSNANVGTYNIRSNSSAVTLAGGTLMNVGAPASPGTSVWTGPITVTAPSALNVAGPSGNGHIILQSNITGSAQINVLGGNNRNIDLYGNSDATFSGPWNIAGSTFVRTLNQGTMGSGVVTNNGGIDWLNTNNATLNSIYANYGSGQFRHLLPAGPITVSGNLSQNSFQLSGRTSEVTFASSAVVNVGALSVAPANSLAVLNMQPGANVTVGNFYIGENSSQTGIVSHAGASVTVTQQFRLGHWPTEVSIYTMDGGSLTMALDPPANPSGTTEANGGFYIGIDGVGVFTQNSGTLTTPDLVLDNRAPTVLGPNNTYTLNGGTLNIGRWGIQSPSTNFSYQVNLGGGTVAASVSWTSALRMTLTGNNGSTTFDPGANSITLNGQLTGGGGLIKEGSGGLLLNGTNSFTGDFTVNAGTLGGNGVVSSLLLVEAGGTLSPGLSVGVMTASNDVVLGGTTFMEISRNGATLTNDRLRVFFGVLYMGGTLNVSNIAQPLIGGEVFDLFDWENNSAEVFVNVNLPPLPANLSWDTSNLYVDGTIAVAGTPTITLSPVSQTVYEGDNVRFTAGATNQAPFTVQWQKDNMDIPGATGTTLALTNVTLDDAGVYTFWASNSFGGNSASATLTVLPVTNLSAGLIAYWPLDTVTGGFTPDLTTNGNHLYLTNMTATNLVAGQRSNAISFYTNVNSLLTRSYGPGNALPGYQYPGYTIAMWVKGPTNQIDRRVYADSSTNNNNPLLNIGTFNSASTNGGVDMFIRTDAGGTAILDHRKSSLEAFNENWHHVTWVDNNGSAQLYVDGILDTNNFNYARGTLTLNTITLGAIQRGTAAAWFQGQIDDVILWRRALNSNEVVCVMTNSLAGPPVITQDPSSQTAECSSNALLTVAATSYDTIRYQWYFGSNPIMDATNALLTFAANPGSAGNYSVVLSNCAGSVTSAVAVLSVQDTTAPTITCSSNIIVIIPTNETSAIVNYTISASDSCGLVSTNCVPPSGSAFGIGTNVVMCSVTDGGGNSANCSFEIVMHRPPSAGEDTLGTIENTAVIAPGIKLLANDSDLDGDILTLLEVSTTSTNGGTVLLSGGMVTFTPATNSFGIDRFTYTIGDGRGGMATGTVVVIVISGNASSQNKVSVTFTPNGRLIRFAGIPTQNYIIQSAADVTGPWANLSPSIPAGPTGLIEYEDTEMPVPIMRFYRTVVSP